MEHGHLEKNVGRSARSRAVAGGAMERFSLDLSLALSTDSDDGLSECSPSGDPQRLAASLGGAIRRGGNTRWPHCPGLYRSGDRAGCHRLGHHAGQRRGVGTIGARHPGDGAGPACHAAGALRNSGAGDNVRRPAVVRSAAGRSVDGDRVGPLGRARRSLPFHPRRRERLWADGVHGWGRCLRFRS